MSTTTTTVPARQRKPRPKPERRIRLCVRPLDGGVGVVRIWVGKVEADYLLALLPTDFGRGFQLTKILDETQSEASRYDVNIDGDNKTCECKGHLKWGHCKHADGLAALIAAGRL